MTGWRSAGMTIAAGDFGSVGTEQADSEPFSTARPSVFHVALPSPVLHAAANSLEMFGTVPTSVKSVLPRSSAAVVVAHGLPAYFACAAYSSSTLRALSDSMNWFMIRALSAFMSTSEYALACVHGNAGTPSTLVITGP